MHSDRSATLGLPLVANLRANAAVWWLVVAAFGLVAFFWDGLVSLGDAWSLPEYSHGPVIPLIAAWLMLRELRDRPPQLYTGSRWPGLAILGLGLGIGLVGNLSQIPDIITYGLLIAIAGIILLGLGPRQGIRLWAGWAFLLFMLPLPNMVYWELSTKLQLISSQAGVGLIQAMRIPVYLDGNIIDLGSYKLQVAEACNGLRYLFPLMGFGFLFAVLYQGPAWHRIVLFLATIPITIAMNSFRIAVIGMLVNQFGIAQAEGFLHYFEGWIIFIACIVLLYLCAYVLQRFTAQPGSVLSVLDLRMGGIGRPLSRIGHVPGNGWLISAAVVLALSGALWQFTPARPNQLVERTSFALFPMQLGEWDGSSVTLDPIIEQVLAADDYLVADYNMTGVAPVNLFVAYYDSLTGGSWIHSPEICIPGGGWEVSRWTQTRIDLETAQPTSFEVNRAIIQKGEQRQLVYYWFEQQGRRLSSDYAAKFYTMWDAMVERRSDAALVRVITPMPRRGGEADADLRLRGFLASALPALPKHVPD